MKEKIKNLIKPVSILSVLAFLLLVFTVTLLIKYNQTKSELNKLATPTPNPSLETINQIGKLMLLPEGESPTVATITDKDKLKSQAFFTQAENGDQIIIYLQAKKAILYRPSINKIVDVAPVNNATPSAQKSQK